MAHYQNQKIIIIHRSNPLSEKKQYLAIDCQALATAARRAPADLVNCGYIIEENGKLNFYETPHDPPLTTNDILLKPEVRIVQTKDGPREVTYNELKDLLLTKIPEHEFMEKWKQLPIVEK